MAEIFIPILSLIDLAWGDTGRVPLVVGAILLGAAALSRGGGDDDAGRRPGCRALACWIPIAAAAIAATILHRGDVAVSIIFCTSVASLSLIQGFVLLISPGDETKTEFRRVWPFVMPVTLMTLLAGFATRLTWMHAMIFLCEGLALFLTWLDLDRGATLPTAKAPVGKINILLWVGLATLGAIAALGGTLQISRPLANPASNLVILAILGPLLVLPLLMTESSLAHGRLSWSATTTAVGVVILNLCLLLPMVILLRYPVENLKAMWDVSPLIFPLITWRVDNVVLLLLSFVLLPTALDRWRLGRAEGITLIGFYLVYLLMEAVAVLKF